MSPILEHLGSGWVTRQREVLDCRKDRMNSGAVCGINQDTSRIEV